MSQQLTKADFLKKVFNYEQKKEWDFQGDVPCVIDFYADWCGPCKMVAPIIDELAEEYKEKIDFYKIDTEREQELAAAFGIQSIPSLLFCQKDEKPQLAVGALPKDTIKEVIDKQLLKTE